MECPRRTTSVVGDSWGVSLGRVNNWNRWALRWTRDAPSAEVFGCDLDFLPCLVTWVDLCVHHMTFGKGDSQEVMDMSWETLEAGFRAHETMDVDEKEFPPFLMMGLIGEQ